MLVKFQLSENAFEPWVWCIGHTMILSGVVAERRDRSGLGDREKPVVRFQFPVFSFLLVAQSFDGVEFGGFDGG
jgi:hypothetical protein